MSNVILMPCEKTSVIEVSVKFRMSEASVILLKNGQEGATQEKKRFEYKESDCKLYKTCKTFTLSTKTVTR